MPIQLVCPTCQLQLRVPDENAGRKARCRCGAILQVPAASASSLDERPQVAPSADAKPIVVQCPGCHHSLRAPASAAGKAVRCKCGQTIAVPAVSAPTVTATRKVSAKSAATSPSSSPSSPTSAVTAPAKPAAARVAARVAASPAARPVASQPANPVGSLFDELTEADWNRESPIARAYAAPPASRDGATLKKFIVEDNPIKDPSATPSQLVALSVLNFIGAALQLFIGVAVFVVVAAVSQLGEVIPLAKVGGALFGAYFIAWGIYMCVVGVGLLQRAPWGWCVAGVAYAHALVDKVLTVVHACTHGVMPARIVGMVGGMMVVLGITMYIYKNETRARFGLKTLTPVIICAAIGGVIAVASYVVIMMLVQSAEALVPQNAG